MEIRDRIKELRRVPARELLRNPKNWRRHPKAQQEALRAIVQEVGVADALIVRESPDGLVLIDGHLRADTLPDMELACLVLDVNEQEADKILATLDPLAAMATADPTNLRALMDKLTWSSDELFEHLRPMWPQSGPATGQAGALVADFGEPPFSVWDARSGRWIERRNAWLALGIQSELGRDDDSIPGGAGQTAAYRDKGRRLRTSPGGSPRPAARLRPGGGTDRGDSHGRPL